MYEFAAHFTLISHFIFILFVVFGGILFFVSTKITYIHIPALIWGIYIELSHSACPLTYLENWFLHEAKLEIYSQSYIQNYLVPIVYPANLTNEMQTYFAITVLVLNLVIYGLITVKYKKTNNQRYL